MHLPDIENFEPLFMHLVTRSLDLLRYDCREVQLRKRNWCFCPCHILYHFEAVWTNRLNLLQHSTTYPIVKCQHKECFRKFHLYKTFEYRRCCVKYKIVNLFELSNFFYRIGKLENSPKTKLEQQNHLLPYCYLNCVERHRKIIGPSGITCKNYQYILAEFYHPDGEFIEQFKHTLNEKNFESMMSLCKSNEKTEKIAFLNFLMDKLSAK